MSNNWINALDACAAGGVLDYDAAAFLLDQPQRFVGHPKFDDIPAISQPLLIPDGIRIKGQLKEDKFDKDGNLVQNPSWKKWLMVGLGVLGVGALLLSKGKFKMPSFKSGSGSSVMTSITDFGKKVWEYVKKPFTWIMGKIKKTP
ncbi:hypothetical protein IJ541_09015 [bacterium]|nr:hypothetical protein [bacterium]